MTKRAYRIKLNLDEVITLYNETRSCLKVAKILGVSKVTIERRLRGMGIVKRARHSVNHDFFAIDSPESFYWAGFIAADGCIVDKKGVAVTLLIGLSSVDEQQLVSFKRAIGYTGKLHYTKERKYCNMNIFSKKICCDLGRFNIVPRKSLIYSVPDHVRDSPHINHFIRGYFDGDGSFFITKDNENSVPKLNFSVCGTEACLDTFCYILVKNGINMSSHLTIMRNIYNLHARGNRKVLKIRDFLYKDSCTELQLGRKYDKVYNDFYNNLPHNFHAKGVIRIDVCGCEKFYRSIVDTEKDGFTASGVSGCCRGINPTHKGFRWKYFNQ